MTVPESVIAACLDEEFSRDVPCEVPFLDQQECPYPARYRVVVSSPCDHARPWKLCCQEHAEEAVLELRAGTVQCGTCYELVTYVRTERL